MVVPEQGAPGIGYRPSNAWQSMTGCEPLRLLLVTDMGLFREGLAQMLAADDSIAAVETASCAAEAEARAAELQPHVSVVDASLLEAVAERLVRHARLTRVVAFGVPDEWESVLACARAGAAGFVTRTCNAADLLQAVHSAYRGELLCTPRMAARMFEQMRVRVAEVEGTGEGSSLTLRELEIGQLLERGLSNKEIARRLHIEQATVKNHVHNILTKLQVTRRGQAAARLRWHTRGRTEGATGA